jgi:hypothetical protein
MAQVAAAAYAYTVSPDVRPAPDTEPRACYAALFSAFAIFFYSTLDNMDGKQARRTGASSPLGLLFDHGCDAVNAGFFGFLSLALHLGGGADSWTTLVLWIVPTAAFFFNTWEEFHTGILVLPIVNGANEGLLLALGVLFTSAFYGQVIWARAHTTLPMAAWALAPVIDACRWAANQPLAYGGGSTTTAGYPQSWLAGAANPSASPITNLEVLLGGAVVAGLFTVLSQVRNVAGVEKARGGWPAVRQALARLLPYILLVLTVCLWLHVPSTALVVRAHWVPFYLTAAAVFGEGATKLMVSHVCDMEYKPQFWATAAFAATPLYLLAR